MEGTAEERACELGKRIRELVDKGEFRLMDLNQHYGGDGVCQGCAIAAAAFVVGQRRADTRVACAKATTDAGLMTREEAAQIEMGYECWKTNRDWTSSVVQRDVESPFYKLGRAMSLNAKHISLPERLMLLEPAPEGGW